jgi:hypothetical protein
MKKNKVKEFVANHKNEIIGFATIAGFTALGIIIGYKVEHAKFDDLFVVEDEKIADILKSAAKIEHSGVYTSCIYDGGVKVDELGKLGEAMMEASKGEAAEFGFTHLVVIGQKME